MPDNSNTTKFDDIRPYHDEEMPTIVEKLLEDPQFKAVVNAAFPNIQWENFKTMLRTFKTPYELQSKFIKDQIFSFAKKTSEKIDCNGFQNIPKNQACTYISNHRDIVLDALLLNAMLLKEGFMTTEVAIGDNLLIYPWLESIVRMNNNFIVKRGASIHQKLENSKHLSQYIHFAVKQKQHSIWIAQREGRAKNSDDRTQESIIKMLAMGGQNDFLQNIKSLNITPLSISYEFDPCDYLKAKEYQMKRDDPNFKKTPMDDEINMLTGLKGFKGKIHFQVGRPINSKLQKINPDLNRNKVATEIASLIDHEIFTNYKLYPINYIAYDKLWGNRPQKNKYTPEEKKETEQYFVDRINKIDLVNKDVPFLTEKLLEMYAYPVKNQLNANEQ
ncbi:MAG: 1-acyl-sn-glycerol-3-phosphate acyltransferase [Dysgonamonadaceae bacterium]|jgi:hypothetical protein|nr:1-acyl-sn-glycerol-3-phosphate acyltransferase [Dysgonamonadaceae bacterium]